MNDGYNIFRIAFKMERLTPSGLTGSLDATYFAALKQVVDYVTTNGGYAVLDPHK